MTKQQAKRIVLPIVRRWTEDARNIADANAYWALVHFRIQYRRFYVEPYAPCHEHILTRAYERAASLWAADSEFLERECPGVGVATPGRQTSARTSAGIVSWRMVEIVCGLLAPDQAPANRAAMGPRGGKSYRDVSRYGTVATTASRVAKATVRLFGFTARER